MTSIHSRLSSLLRLLLLIAVMAMSGPSQAASPSRLYFDHYNDRVGLTSNSVSYIIQDSQGFIWVATKDGLNRLDGFNFRHINTDDRESCSSVTTLYEDADGLIWVGAHNGVFIYDPVTEHLKKFNVPRPNGNVITQQVIQFLPDKEGNILMVVDSDGVYSYNKESQKLSTLYHSDSIKVNQAVFDPFGRLWIGTFGQGLFYSDDRLKTLKRFDLEADNDTNSAIISDLKINGDKLYVATERYGVISIDITNNRQKRIFIDDQNGQVTYVRQLMFDSQGLLYIASENGVFVYDLLKGEITNHLTHNIFDRYSISDNAVYALLCDREGGIWVGSYFGGLDYADTGRMKFDKYYPANTLNTLTGQRVRELCMDTVTGLLYVGTEDHGLNSFDPKTGQFAPIEGITSNNVHGLCIDNRKLLIGTFSQGLKIKNLNTGAIQTYTTAQGLLSDFVFSIKRTMNGEIVIGTMGGLQIFDPATETFQTVPEFANIFIYDILEDLKGNLWVATYDHGLYQRPAAHTDWIRYQWNPADVNSIPSDKVYGLYQDSDGMIWVMTQDGLCTYNPADSSFRQDYLGSDRVRGVVYQVIDDDYGRLWLTTNHGLYCLDRKTGNLRRFSTSGGLPTNQFNYRSSLKGDDGKLYFGTIEGLVGFQPLGFNFDTRSISPIIDELYLNGRLTLPEDADSPLEKSITQTKELKLKSHQNSIGFKIVSLLYSSLGEQSIMYKLEGFDKEWHHVPLAEALLSYSNLDYGKYILKVASSNEDGTMAEEPLELKITISAPFYLTWWAKLIYILLTIGIICVIFWLYRRNSQLNNQRYLENYTAEKEREAYDSKINFFTNVAHEIRTPLTLIKVPLDCMSKSLSINKNADVKENLDVINLNVDRLLLLANQLLDFRKMEDGKFQIKKQTVDVTEIINSVLTRFRPTIESSGKTLEVSLPEQPVIAYADSEAITKIISNLFTNAIKYGKTFITLSLTAAPDAFSITIANDGEVVAPEKREEIFTLFMRLENNKNIPGTGLGLAYARSLAQMHGGSLAMTDNLQINEFVLTIPLAHAAEGRKDEEEANPQNLEQMIKANSQAVTILLADDNIEMLTFLERRLIASGYKVIKASDGRMALDLLESEYVDIVVSDVMMPEIDGIELLERIKSDVNYSHIPVILLTAKTRMEDKVSGLDSGADAYIEKPFAIEYLIANITMLLRNRERIRQRLERMPYKKAAGKTLNKVDEEFLTKINDIIQANFNNPDFSMEDVIANMGMSRTSFYRKIKGMLDLNPNEYIKIERLKRAAQLFEEGHTSVSEVCYMVGFSSPGYFTKCFQKQFGLSPRDYITNHTTKKPATDD